MTGSLGSVDVSVIIPARDAVATIGATLRSVLAQDPPPTQIVVAIPPGDEATRAEVAETASALDADVVTIVDNPTGRTPDGLNAALAAATGDVIARVDAHAVPPPGYLATALERLAQDDRIGNVGGIQRPVGSDPGSRAVAAAMQSPLGSGGAAHRSGTEPGPIDTVYLGVFRAEALADVGGFDRRFTRNQDYELNVRLREAGWTVWFDPAMVVEYRPRSSLRALARQYFEYGRWRRATLRLHPGSRQVRQLALPAALAIFVLSTVAGWVSGAPWVGPILIAVWIGLLTIEALPGAGRANPLRVALALALMHVCWTAGLLVGPPRGWQDLPEA